MRRSFAEWAGRVLLLGAVAFWWGAIVLPRLVSLTFPELLSPDAVPPHLNPDREGSLANTVSAIFLLITALLALGNAVVSRRRGAGLIAVGGWTALAVMTASVAWEEKADFKGGFAPAAGRWLFGELWSNTSVIESAWVLMSPLIMTFVVAMWFLIHKGLSTRAVRAPLILGLTAWLLAIVYDEGAHKIALLGWTKTLSVLLEETLEFSGTLIIGLAAALSLSKGRGRELAPGVFGGRRLLRLALGSMAVVAVLGGFVVSGAASTYREQLVDTRGLVGFNVSLANEQSLVQEIGVVSAPMASLKLRVTSRDSQDRSGVILWRVREAGVGGSGPILREGRMEVAAGIHPRWENIDFPLLVEAEGRPLAVQLIAEVEPEAHLRIGGTKTNRLEHLQFWINGMKTWPDQNLELVAYGPGELTRSKFQAIWSHFTWSWPALAGAAIVGLWIITFIPALLVTVARQRL